MVRARDSVGELEIRSSADEAGREPGFLDLTGREIGRYRIQQRLGRGGVTTVYQAYDNVDDVPVALKVLLHGNDEKLYNRFRQEAQTAAKLHHPHIVRTLRVGVTPGSDTAYIAMELVEGEDLAAMLAMRRRLTPEESCLLLYPIARALAYAHSQGIIHRDVKPSNILLRTAANEIENSVTVEALDYPVVPLLGDFGIARALDLPELTSWGRTVGTPAFMAPEQAQGQRGVDHRADIYALGAVLYRCITGRAPFSGTTVQILHAHVYNSVSISEEIQRQLSPRHIQLLQRTLAKDPDDRYKSAEAMAEDLLLGSDPERDELTEDEREVGATLTLDLISLGEQTPPTAHENILIPGVQNPRELATPSVAVAHNGQVTSQVTPPTALQRIDPVTPSKTVDPHFDAELDQRLQFWVWVVLTALVIGALTYLIFFGEPAAESTANAALPQPTLSVEDSSFREITVGFVPQLADDADDTTTAPDTEIPLMGDATLLSPDDSASSTNTDTATPTITIAAPADSFVPTDMPTPAPDLQAHQNDMTTPEQSVENNGGSTVSGTLIYGNVSNAAEHQEPSEPQINGHCLSTVDSVLLPHIRTLATELQESFRCPIEQAKRMPGEYLEFKNGEMLYLASMGQMLVTYRGNYNGIRDPWADFPVAWFRSDSPNADVPLFVPDEGEFYPEGIFRVLWSKGEIAARLQSANTPRAEAVSLLVQRFQSGWFVLRYAADGQGEPQLHYYPSAHRLL